jgi:hypothetical protein
MATDSAIKRDVAFAKGLGLTRLDVIVNDHSAARRERPFDTYTRTRIFALCRAASDAGMETNLTSWLMPHAAYIDRAAGEIGAIMLGSGAQSVCFDAEEPYTKALDPLPYEVAAQRVADKMHELPWGITAIGYPNATKLKPLVYRASYVAIQAYSTNSPQTAAPEVVAPRYIAHWKSIFPSLVVKNTPVLAGLAAYNQEGIPGHTAAQAIRAAFLGAEHAHARDVVWWSLSAIRNDKNVATAIRDAITRVTDKPVNPEVT